MASPIQLYLIHPDPGQLDRAISVFLDAKRAAGLSPATLDFYAYTLDSYARHAGGWPPTPGTCQAFLLDLRRRGRSQATLHTYYGALAVFFNWCVAQGSLPANPLSQVDRPQQPRPIPRAVPKAILARLFAALEAVANAGDLLAARNLALFRLIYDCGLRATEAARLKICEVDLEEHAATIQHAKGGQGRVVYFGHETRRALVVWMAAIHPGCPWLFTSAQVNRGMQPITRTGVHQALVRWCDRAGVEHFRVHDLRHSYARHALRAGIDAEMVSRQLGHHDVGFTLSVYGCSEDADRRDVHLRLSPGDHL